MLYQDYMDSRAWAQRKIVYWQAHDRRCRRCANDVAVQLHHLSYERMGREPDEDLMPLCQRCHSLAHQHHREVGGSLRAATEYVVKPATTTARTNARPKAPRVASSKIFVPRHLRDVKTDESGRTLVTRPGWSREDWRRGSR